jgi:hypothetical protein
MCHVSMKRLIKVSPFINEISDQTPIWSPGIYSKKSIQPGYIGWLTGTSSGVNYTVQGAVWLSVGCSVAQLRGQCVSVSSSLACCKAGPSSNLGSAPHGGSAH